MSEAFETFHAGLIDYAGLFPPAALDLEAAYNNYLAYSESPDSWMLGSFVIPASRLSELTELISETDFGAGGLRTISALIGGGDTGEDYLEELGQHLQELAQFELLHPGVIISLETRLPADVALTHDRVKIAGLLREVEAGIKAAGFGSTRVFVETPALAEQDSVDDAALQALAKLRWYGGGVEFCFKLRCGGLEPAAFPTPERVIRLILLCRDREIPLKFTAGLHHPLRHFSEEIGTMMHGFWNVYGAGVLAFAGQADEAELLKLISDPEADHFTFDGATFAWRSYRATAEEVDRARGDLLHGFGSCSFDDPRNDLTYLGLLD